MLLEQSRTFYFLWWNKSNIEEIKATLCFACQINISLKIINKLKFLGILRNPTRWETCPHTKKIKLKLLVLFVDELENKSGVFEKMPVPALRFTYSHFHNNYVKIVSTGTLQTKIKKTMIKEKHLIRIIFYVNEETRPRPSFQEYTLDICQMNLL